MKPDTLTVQQLFERDVRYLIPLYQRPYVWNEEQQWAPLWDDVSALIQHQEGRDASGLWSHFLGALVLDQEPTAPGKIPQYTVIDGQQRLTTLQLLIAAAAKAMAGAHADNDAELLRELVTNNPRKAQGTEQLKIWPTNANRDAFVAAMAHDGPPPGHVNDPGNLIDEAFEYFTNQITDYLTDAGDDDKEEFAASTESVHDSQHQVGQHISGELQSLVAARAERLRITICDLVKVVSIALESGDNAQVIFETMNARGTPLLALDLVKNALFREASKQGCETDSLYENVWQPQLDDDYWREKRRQGRLNRPLGELFLMHWLTMRLERVIPATELFANFRQGVLRPGVDAASLIRELCADAAVMRSFDTPKSSEAEFFARQETLDAGTVLPIVLLLFRSPEVSEERRRRALRILESWLTRRSLMRFTTKNYNRLVARLVARMKTHLPHADEILLRELSGGEGPAIRWPRDEEFIAYLRTRDVYSIAAHRRRIVMALTAIEASLHSNKTDISATTAPLSLEHMLPQEWQTNWQVEDVDGSPLEGEALEQATEARWERLHRLGNLTIVAVPLNSAMSNAAWTTKRAELNRHSRLLLNARLAEHDKWDVQDIDDHGDWLAHRLARIWPGPEAENWT